jgi:hypothetical protein
MIQNNRKYLQKAKEVFANNTKGRKIYSFLLFENNLETRIINAAYFLV